MVHVRHRFKLLLDENIPPRERFRRLNNRYDLKHLIHDLKQKEGMEDLNVHKLAAKLGRLIITFNRKDFEPLADKSRQTGIISISQNLFYEQIDKKIAALLSRSKKGDLFGKFFHITFP